jgi:glycerol-3-phosphate acyltransferase PlsY
MTTTYIITLLCALISYIIGSFPTGKIIAHWYGIDIEKVGSGNVGATNLARVVGKRAGFVTLIVDVLKGAFVVLIARLFGVEIVMSIAVVIGHCYSLPGLKGGKGVATALGVISALSISLGCIALGIFAIVFSITKYVSASSVTAALLVPLISFFIYPSEHYNLSLAIIGIIVTLRHVENLERLVRGQEAKFSFAK